MGGSRYRELGPERLPAPVRGPLECAWRAEVPADGPVHEQRVLPDGCMDLLLVDGRIVVAGPDSVAHVARSVPGSATTGLRFRPGALPALLGVAADAVRDHRVDLLDLIPRGRPGARSAAGSTAEMRLTVAGGPADDADAHLGGGGPAARHGRGGPAARHGGDRTATHRGGTGPAARLGGTGLAALLDTTTALLAASEQDRHRLPEPLPGSALRALAAGMPTAELAARIGVTTRTLHRRCVATLGYGPSVARRVLRFRTAAGLLHAGVAPAEVAARAGYADQPHLSREVRALAGVSPTALVPPARQAPGAPTHANRSSDEPSGSVTVA